MTNAKRGRSTAVGAGLLGLTLLVTACGTGDTGGGGGGGGGTAAGGGADQEGCEAYEQYQGNEGTTVSMYTSIRDIEADRYIQSFEEFERCTGIDIAYEGTGEFEAQLNVRVQGGNAPDLAFIPQPGLLARFVQAGQVVEPPAEVEQNVDEYWSEDWKEYGSVDGTFYAAPMGANVKSYVWYSPATFSERGYEIPETWDDMIALSDQMVADGLDPWCAGIESGDATGWPATDWLEDVMLREHGPDVYDQWVANEIPFDDPQVVQALDRVGEILKNEEYVNSTFGGVQSIVTTSFQDGGLPVATGECGMHRQASFFANQWPEGTTVAEDGDVFAFYLPTIGGGDERPVLGGGEFVAAFSDRPEVQAVQTYLTSPEYHNLKASIGDWISAHQGLETESVESPIDQLSVETLQDENAVFRFDGSDLMPAAVGAGTFWRGMVEWLNGAESQQVLSNIEQSFPAS